VMQKGGDGMPINYKNYPTKWKEQSLRIRAIRANNRCELCNAENGKPHWKTGSRVVLTVAHLDPLWNVSKECPDKELLALCQRCHLKIDVVMKKRKRQEKKNYVSPRLL
jgi:hypothetical protein